MSVRVEISEVRDRLVEFGAAPYLLTTSPEGRPHATHVVVVFDGERLECDAGRKTARNASVNAGVCLLWPPCEPGGFSLLIDGDATVGSHGETTVLSIVPTAAVLHRNANPDGYIADCVPLDGR